VKKKCNHKDLVDPLHEWDRRLGEPNVLLLLCECVCVCLPGMTLTGCACSATVSLVKSKPTIECISGKLGDLDCIEQWGRLVAFLSKHNGKPQGELMQAAEVMHHDLLEIAQDLSWEHFKSIWSGFQHKKSENADPKSDWLMNPFFGETIISSDCD